MGIVNNGESFSIHDSKDPSATFQECAVEDEIASLRQACLRAWWMLQPVADHSPDCRDAVTTLHGQLPHGVSFDNPSFKPNPLSQMLVAFVSPAKRTATVMTQPALSSMTALAIAAYIQRTASGTVLFLSL